MPLLDKPIHERSGFREEKQAGKPDALQRDLAALASKHGLWGCVLVQFYGERVGVRSWGMNDIACSGMTTLGDRILTDIDDGRHDPLDHIPPEGSA